MNAAKQSDLQALYAQKGERCEIQACTCEGHEPSAIVSPMATIASGEWFVQQPGLFQELVAPAANEGQDTTPMAAAGRPETSARLASRPERSGQKKPASVHLRRARKLARHLRTVTQTPVSRRQLAHALCDELLALLEERTEVSA